MSGDLPTRSGVRRLPPEDAGFSSPARYPMRHFGLESRTAAASASDPPAQWPGLEMPEGEPKRLRLGWPLALASLPRSRREGRSPAVAILSGSGAALASAKAGILVGFQRSILAWLPVRSFLPSSFGRSSGASGLPESEPDLPGKGYAYGWAWSRKSGRHASPNGLT
jgi:hypothetical protein